MDKLSILTQINEREDLLSLPQALAEILREVDNPDFTTDSLSQIILKDPSLTGRILKMANSSYYSRFSGISTVHQAVQVLGANTVRCLALSSSIFHPDKIKRDIGIDPQKYFTNVLTVAAAAEKIAQAMGHKATEEAFIAGLMHDIGTMFLLHNYPSEYREIINKAVPNTNILDAERALFDTDHCEIGYHLIIKWRLPDYIAEATRDHHNFADTSKSKSIVAMVRLASLLTNDSADGYAMDLEDRLQAINQASEVLGLSKTEVDGISVQLMSAAIAAAEYLGIDIGDIEDMLAKANKEIWQTYLMIENLFRERQDLSQKLLDQERARGASESKAVAMATLSHYLNNAAMVIYGRSQILRMQFKNEKREELLEKLPESLDIIDNSIMKIVAVLTEMKEVSPIDKVEFLSMSRAMNIDDRIKERMDALESDSGLLLPEEARLI